ncbi:DUF485 domain-containing protein [Thalassoglobus sp. JC818]|uniref:DUF485 domain-containing protein n=1 Tax=Thalassoglobus sp. JC818 TaxID=3232136 RepID=UPI003459DFE3
MQARNSRIGLILFWIYLIFYVIFVLLNAYRPEAMRATPIEGINLAVLYGFALILSAFLLAILYGLLCRSEPQKEEEGQE